MCIVHALFSSEVLSKKDYENKYFETLVCYKSITEEEYEHIEAKTDQTKTRRKTQGKEK